MSHLDMLLQLHLVLSRELLVLTLELFDEALPLYLLLLFEDQQFLLKLMLAVIRGRQGQLMIHAQIHGDGRRGQVQWQCGTHINCGERMSY